MSIRIINQSTSPQDFAIFQQSPDGLLGSQQTSTNETSKVQPGGCPQAWTSSGGDCRPTCTPWQLAVLAQYRR